jgi:hypothetical protein
MQTETLCQNKWLYDFLSSDLKKCYVICPDGKRGEYRDHIFDRYKDSELLRFVDLSFVDEDFPIGMIVEGTVFVADLRPTPLALGGAAKVLGQAPKQ